MPAEAGEVERDEAVKSVVHAEPGDDGARVRIGEAARGCRGIRERHAAVGQRSRRGQRALPPRRAASRQPAPSSDLPCAVASARASAASGMEARPAGRSRRRPPTGRPRSATGPAPSPRNTAPRRPGTKTGSRGRRHRAGRGAEDVGHALARRVAARADGADAAGMGVDQAGARPRCRRASPSSAAAASVRPAAERRCRRRRSRVPMRAKPSSASTPRPMARK